MYFCLFPHHSYTVYSVWFSAYVIYPSSHVLCFSDCSRQRKAGTLIRHWLWLYSFKYRAAISSIVCVCVYVHVRASTDVNFTDFKGTRPHRNTGSRQQVCRVFFFFLSFSTEIDHSCTTTHTHMHNEVHSCEERGGKCESCSLSEQETKTVIKHDQCFKEKGSGTCSPHVKHFFMSPSQSPVLPVILSLWACCRGEGHQIQRDRLPSTEKHNWI